MKHCAYLTLLLISFSIHAGNYRCGADGLLDPAHIKAHEFLSLMQGRVQVGRCFIELQMCDATLPTEAGSTVGDIAVTDAHGQPFYVAFDFSSVQTEKVTKVLINGRRMLHYEFIAHLPSAAAGRTEAYRLEILKSEDLTTLESVHLGVFTSRLRAQFPHLRAGRGYWAVCEK